MITAADAAGRVLGVAENEAYEPWVDRIRTMIADREPFGELAFAMVTAGGRVPATYPGRRSWLTRVELGGTGPWMLLGCRYRRHRPTDAGRGRDGLRARASDLGYERPDLEGTVHALLTLEGGATVTLVQTAEVDLGTERKVVWLHGDRGVLRADRAGWSLHRAGVRPPAAEIGGWGDEGRRRHTHWSWPRSLGPSTGSRRCRHRDATSEAVSRSCWRSKSRCARGCPSDSIEAAHR